MRSVCDALGDAVSRGDAVTFSVTPASVTTQRKRLGRLVHDARTSKGLTQAALGELIGCKQAKVNKIEGGSAGTKPADLDSIVEVLEIDPSTAARMRTLNEASMPQRVRSARRASTPEWFRGIIDLEADATEMFSWTGERIPGLLQSDFYMLTQFQMVRSDDVTDPVVERSSRQKIFERNPGREYHFILSESALDRLVRSLNPMTALDQIEHMIELAEKHSSLDIRVIPYTAASYLDPDYTILRFPDEGMDFAHAEYVTNIVKMKGDELQICVESWEALSQLALSPGDTMLLLRKTAQLCLDGGSP
jgi:transcriptional regulator with XRE-family HTH domain